MWRVISTRYPWYTGSWIVKILIWNGCYDNNMMYTPTTKLPGLSVPVAFSFKNKSMSSSTLQFSNALRMFS